MSAKLDPREVLHYLNELGYYDISTHQLKAFMTDLKKLILYDLKKENQQEKENHQPPQIISHPKTVREYFQQKHLRQQIEKNKNFEQNQQRPQTAKTFQTTRPKSVPSITKNNIFNHLHSASTVSSRARSLRTTSQESQRIPNFYEIPNRPIDSQQFTSAYTITTNDYSNDYVSDDVSVDTKPSRSDLRRDIRMISERKPTVSFIRPQTAKKQYSEKSDPVALYQMYKSEWSKQKLPGDHGHKNVRWCVREKMLSGPDIQVRPSQSVVPTTVSTKNYKTRL